VVPPGPASEKRVNELLNDVLRDRLRRCPEAILLGEDIADRSPGTEADYGGAFKVTRGLSTAFPGRVINFPISEAALIGFGTGLAIAGFRPIVEIMFGDFMTLTFDQILQHAAKFRRMFAGRVKVPLIIRTPMGGKRGYGPTHSQSLEKFFLGIPDLAVIALNAAVPPERVYEAVFAREDPTLVVENKVLYTLPIQPRPATDEPFPTVRVTMDDLAPAVTIVCYGEMLGSVSEAAHRTFIEDEVVSEIVAPTCLHPLNIAPIAESVARSRRLVVVEEGTSTAAFGSEVIARLAETGVRIDAFRRLGNNTIVPSSLAAEMELLPNVRSIAAAIRACAGAKRS
jgi:2-oxoisovalerate dehydrogenase E1 component